CRQSICLQASLFPSSILWTSVRLCRLPVWVLRRMLYARMDAVGMALAERLLLNANENRSMSKRLSGAPRRRVFVWAGFQRRDTERQCRMLQLSGNRRVSYLKAGVRLLTKEQHHDAQDRDWIGRRGDRHRRFDIECVGL